MEAWLDACALLHHVIMCLHAHAIFSCKQLSAYLNKRQQPVVVARCIQKTYPKQSELEHGLSNQSREAAAGVDANLQGRWLLAVGNLDLIAG